MHYSAISLYVLKRSLKAYKDASIWKLFTTILPVDPESPEIYTITFENWDGEELLQLTEVEEGTIPVYTGETPVRPEDYEYTYTFSGWTPELVAATEDATYTATFKATPIPQEEEGIEETQTTAPTPSMLFRNGQIFIHRNGRMYTMQEQEVE